MLSKFSRAVLAPLAISTLLATSAFAQGGGVPTLKIAAPQEGQTFYGDKLPILMTVENFKLVDQTYKTRVAGQGHIHLWLDDANPTKDNATVVIEDNFTFSDVPTGDHKLTAELVTSDHASLRPPVVTTVNFKSAPLSSPSPIATSGFDKNTALVIFVVVALVILAAWWYTKEEDEDMEEISKESKVTKVTKGTKAKAKKSASRKRK